MKAFVRHNLKLRPSLSIYLNLAFAILYVVTLGPLVSLCWMSLPATGGDMGSHFWPVVALREYGLPNFNLRIWNPGNYFGEPLLVHYFPLPFLLAALASYFMPAGLAFNLASASPLLILPLTCWWTGYRLGRFYLWPRDMVNIFAALCGIFVLSFMFNKGNTMWGGNIFSVMAGQFAHQWAFIFFFALVGFLPFALRGLRGDIIKSALCFAGVVMSHGYVALFLPLLFLGALAYPDIRPKKKLAVLFIVGLGGSLLSVWYWWPLISNTKWTTPYALVWNFQDPINEILPIQIAPQLLVLLSGLLIYTFLSPTYLRRFAFFVLPWLPQLLFGA